MLQRGAIAHASASPRVRGSRLIEDCGVRIAECRKTSGKPLVPSCFGVTRLRVFLFRFFVSSASLPVRATRELCWLMIPMRRTDGGSVGRPTEYAATTLRFLCPEFSRPDPACTVHDHGFDADSGKSGDPGAFRSLCHQEYAALRSQEQISGAI